MKKKFNFWLQIVTICFCICAIAVGVYSATTASITASGKVGFVAHGCNVNVTGQIYGHAAGNKADGLPVKEANAENLNGGTAVQVRGNAQNLPIGNRYFSDMESSDGKPADIVITLTVTNVSKFAVTATVDAGATQKPSNAISVSFDKTTADMQENGTATFKITISMNETSGAYAPITMPTTNNFSIEIEFDRYQESASYSLTVIDETYDTLNSYRCGYWSINGGEFTVINSGYMSFSIDKVTTVQFYCNTEVSYLKLAVYIGGNMNNGTLFCDISGDMENKYSNVLTLTEDTTIHVYYGMGF